MIKYRVYELAKDLEVASKDVINAIRECLGDEKKHMTALDAKEIDVILEYYTQNNQVKNFDEYFASKNSQQSDDISEKIADNSENEKITKETNQNLGNAENKVLSESEVSKRSKGRASFKASSVSSTDTPKNHKISKTSTEKKSPEKIIKIQSNDTQKDGILLSEEKENTLQNRVVNTRTVSMNIEKYNEKYDKMAAEKVQTDNIIRKQKINQKSQRRGKLKSAKRETEAERLNRIAMERKARAITISVPNEITVGELAMKLKATAAEVVKKLMMMGMMATVNDVIDFDTAELVAMEFHAKVEKEIVVTIEDKIIDDSEDDEKDLLPRSPVVVVMGHVDHGKTSLLDTIRNTNVMSTEAGGITQHIGAYRVKINDREITFLDTPGHEAFTTMRARGAQITDIAILVVAADDGIMPQTIEAINHAKDAGVSIIVAINKIDKEGANPDRVKQQLTEHDILPEEWGGDVPCIQVSAKNKQGIEELLEMVLLVADLKELKANPNRAAKGTIIEARLDKGRGPVATVLIQNGTLKVGDIVVAGTTVGHVRTMINDLGQRVTEAGPSVPVEITGLDGVPSGGDIFDVVSNEKLAKQLTEQRKNQKKEDKFGTQTKVTLDNLFDQMRIGDIKELKVIVKGDVQGSVEAVRQSLERLSNDEVMVKVIHGAVGAINESDVMLANASNAIIVGFNVRPDTIASESAERHNVDMRLYRVIYDCIEEISAAMKGMLDPSFREVTLGRAECRQVYKISSIGTISGSYVVSGKILRDAQIRVVRDGIVITEDKIRSLRRFKDDVKEVAQGYECGIGLENFNDIKEGDILEAFQMEEYRD